MCAQKRLLASFYEQKSKLLRKGGYFGDSTGDYCRAEVTKVDTRNLDNSLHREPRNSVCC